MHEPQLHSLKSVFVAAMNRCASANPYLLSNL
jgi:hypothetical protein